MASSQNQGKYGVADPFLQQVRRGLDSRHNGSGTSAGCEDQGTVRSISRGWKWAPYHRSAGPRDRLGVYSVVETEISEAPGGEDLNLELVG